MNPKITIGDIMDQLIELKDIKAYLHKRLENQIGNLQANRRHINKLIDSIDSSISDIETKYFT